MAPKKAKRKIIDVVFSENVEGETGTNDLEPTGEEQGKREGEKERQETISEQKKEIKHEVAQKPVHVERQRVEYIVQPSEIKKQVPEVNEIKEQSPAPKVQQQSIDNPIHERIIPKKKKVTEQKPLKKPLKKKKIIVGADMFNDFDPEIQESAQVPSQQDTDSAKVEQITPAKGKDVESTVVQNQLPKQVQQPQCPRVQQSSNYQQTRDPEQTFEEVIPTPEREERDETIQAPKQQPTQQSVPVVAPTQNQIITQQQIPVQKGSKDLSRRSEEGDERDQIEYSPVQQERGEIKGEQVEKEKEAVEIRQQVEEQAKEEVKDQGKEQFKQQNQESIKEQVPKSEYTTRPDSINTQQPQIISSNEALETQLKGQQQTAQPQQSNKPTTNTQQCLDPQPSVGLQPSTPILQPQPEQSLAQKQQIQVISEPPVQQVKQKQKVKEKKVAGKKKKDVVVKKPAGSKKMMQFEIEAINLEQKEEPVETVEKEENVEMIQQEKNEGLETKLAEEEGEKEKEVELKGETQTIIEADREDSNIEQLKRQEQLKREQLRKEEQRKKEQLNNQAFIKEQQPTQSLTPPKQQPQTVSQHFKSIQSNNSHFDDSIKKKPQQQIREQIVIDLITTLQPKAKLSKTTKGSKVPKKPVPKKKAEINIGAVQIEEYVDKQEIAVEQNKIEDISGQEAKKEEQRKQQKRVQNKVEEKVEEQKVLVEDPPATFTLPQPVQEVIVQQQESVQTVIIAEQPKVQQTHPEKQTPLQPINVAQQIIEPEILQFQMAPKKKKVTKPDTKQPKKGIKAKKPFVSESPIVVETVVNNPSEVQILSQPTEKQNPVALAPKPIPEVIETRFQEDRVDDKTHITSSKVHSRSQVPMRQSIRQAPTFNRISLPQTNTTSTSMKHLLTKINMSHIKQDSRIILRQTTSMLKEDILSHAIQRASNPLLHRQPRDDNQPNSNAHFRFTL